MARVNREAVVDDKLKLMSVFLDRALTLFRYCTQTKKKIHQTNREVNSLSSQLCLQL